MDAARPSPDIPALLGVWRRSLLVTADGARDEASDVYWLQSRTLCGDIRREPGADGSPSLTAFAGRLAKRDRIFRWERELASYAAVATPDEGWLAWEGEALREDGVHSPYLEIWRPMAKPGPPDFAAQLRHDRDGRTGYLLSIGAYLFIARSGVPGDPGDRPSFAFAGLDQAGSIIELQAGAPFEAEPLARLREVAAALAAGWNATAVDGWIIAALERPFLLADLGTTHF
jgi:hypothetical protein